MTRDILSLKIHDIINELNSRHFDYYEFGSGSGLVVEYSWLSHYLIQEIYDNHHFDAFNERFKTFKEQDLSLSTIRQNILFLKEKLKHINSHFDSILIEFRHQILYESERISKLTEQEQIEFISQIKEIFVRLKRGWIKKDRQYKLIPNSIIRSSIDVFEKRNKLLELNKNYFIDYELLQIIESDLYQTGKIRKDIDFINLVSKISYRTDYIQAIKDAIDLVLENKITLKNNTKVKLIRGKSFNLSEVFKIVSNDLALEYQGNESIVTNQNFNYINRTLISTSEKNELREYFYTCNNRMNKNE